MPDSRQQDAVLLIRAMIAAANADGTIDQEERLRILDQFQVVQPSCEERSFLESELQTPASIDQLVAEVRSVEMARQIYTASLLAIIVDTDAERRYLKTLAERLGLSAEDRNSIHRRLEISGL